jgi:hypothetical protein
VKLRLVLAKPEGATPTPMSALPPLRLRQARSPQSDSSAPKTPRKSLRGLWAEFNIDISDEDIAELRREMWGNFPREDIA